MSYKTKITIFIALIFITLTACVVMNRGLWNDGVCRKCGGEMEYKDTEYEVSYSKNGSRTTAHHIYQCKDCNHHVSLTIDPMGFWGIVYN